MGAVLGGFQAKGLDEVVQSVDYGGVSASERVIFWEFGLFSGLHN